MKNSSKEPAKSLSEWLVLATFGLAAPAHERIKLEIEAHYADAVAVGLDQGLSQKDAEAAALLELGDPKAAAKSFRKRHLTEADEKWINWVVARYQRKNYRRRLIWSGLFFVGMGGCLLLAPSASFGTETNRMITILGLGLICLYFYCDLRCSRLAKASPMGPDVLRKLLFLDSVKWPAAYVFFSTANLPAKHYGLMLGFALLIPATLLSRRTWVWRKLPRIESGDGKGLAA